MTTFTFKNIWHIPLAHLVRAFKYLVISLKHSVSRDLDLEHFPISWILTFPLFFMCRIFMCGIVWDSVQCSLPKHTGSSETKIKTKLIFFYVILRCMLSIVIQKRDRKLKPGKWSHYCDYLMKLLKFVGFYKSLRD